MRHYLLNLFLCLCFIHIVPNVLYSQKKSNNSPLFKASPSSKTTITFQNIITENFDNNPLKYQYIYNGGGVALGDINNDGLIDIYFSGNIVSDRLYLNKGNLVFEDITDKALPTVDNHWSTGVTMADINNDGLLDIYVSCAGPDAKKYNPKNILYINQGNLSFTEEATDRGLADVSLSTQAAFFDYDLDGDLDAYVMNFPKKNNLSLVRPTYSSEENENGHDHLYENNNGQFTNISQNLDDQRFAYGLGLSIGDINNDGYPDIFVANDFETADYLYINNKGTLENQNNKKLKHNCWFGMGTDIADFNNDGYLDIMELDMAFSSHLRSKTNMDLMSSQRFYQTLKKEKQYQYMYNCLQLNNGNATFSDISQLAGVAKSDWSWGTLFADFDNDGYKDIVITNGYKRDTKNRDFQARIQKQMKGLVDSVYQEFVKNPDNEEIKEKLEKTYTKIYIEALLQSPSFKEPNVLFKNNGDLTFSNVSQQWGFSEKVNSNGIAYADLDNDGDLDIVINNLDTLASIYENTSKTNNYLDVQLKGTPSNPFAIGAKVSIYINDKQQTLELFPTRGYQSSVDYRLHFGIGNDKKVDKIEVRWPDQKTTVIKEITSNQTLLIDYSTSTFINSAPHSNPTFFTNITEKLQLKHEHKDKDYDDFHQQVLLPHRLSQQGPCITVGDVNNDNLQDIFIGGAKGTPTKLYLQSSTGTFKDAQIIDFYRDIICEDIGYLLFDYDNDNDLDLYVASGSNEYHEGHNGLQDRIYNNQNGNFVKVNILPKMITSTKIVKAADFDGDGDLDLFIGGRVVAGKYPSSPRSYLLKNEEGRFVDVTESYCKDLLHPGMITGADFGDVNGDGKTDLTLIGEWTPLMTFINKGDSFEKMPTQEETESLWFSLKAVDVDQDGDLDFVGGNLGKNCKFKASKDKPFNIYADDFDGNGTWDMMMSAYEGDKNFPVRGRDCSSEQMPFITDSFPTFKAFAIAEITEICGPKIDNALHLTARGFYSSVFINDGKGNFTMKKLPNEAQFSPTQDILAEDINQDGNIDLILVGNLYETEVETVRYDAGRGCVLLGDGKGNFEALSPQESGLLAWDNVKGIAPITIGDKKVYLMTVNQGKLLAFERR